YYLVMPAPAIAALVGIGVVALWTGFRARPRRGWLLPPALVGCAVVEARILSDFPEWQARLTLPVLVLATLAAMLLSDLRHTRLPRLPAWSAAVAALGLLVLLAPPAAWAAVTVWDGPNTSLPSAGPDQLPAGSWFPHTA